MSYLDEVRKRADAATPGPWLANMGNWQIESRNHSCYRDGICGFSYDQRNGIDLDSINPIDPIDDAEFIAHARTDITELLHRLEIAEKALSEVENHWHHPIEPPVTCSACAALAAIRAEGPKK